MRTTDSRLPGIRLLPAWIVIVLTAGIDQWIKHWIMAEFSLYEERPFLKIGSLDILHLHYIENNGSAFSSFSGQRVLLLTMTIIAMLVCIFILCRYSRKKPLLYWSLTMILGGGIGNLIDRLFHGGFVVDYLDVQLFSFAIFNFADCLVSVGTVLLMIDILFFTETAEKEKAHDKT